MDSVLQIILNPLIGYYLPIEDTNIKIAITLFITNIVISFYHRLDLGYYWNKFENWAIIRKTITINKKNPSYEKVIEHYYNTHTEHVKRCDLHENYGKNKLMIENFENSYIVEKFHDDISDKEYDVNISLDSRGESSVINIFGKCSIEILDRYITSIIRKCNNKTFNKVPIYTFNIYGSKKKGNRSIYWKSTTNKLSKNMENTIVSNDVYESFYMDLKNFMKNEEKYGSKGLPYKRGYVLHGDPGTGKTSLIKAVANEFQLPIFNIDLNQLATNDELVKVIKDINTHIADEQKYLLVFEDVDRTKLFQKQRYYDDKANISENCLLNVLDGIDEGYGRVTIFTCNDSKKMENIKGFNRPGRIDKFVKVTLCDTKHVNDILKFHYPEYKFKIKNGISISPAILIQIILIKNDPEFVEAVLNKVSNFNKFDVNKIMRMSLEQLKAPQPQKNKPPQAIEKIDMVDSEQQSKSYKIRSTISHTSTPKKKDTEEIRWNTTSMIKLSNYVKTLEKLKLEIKSLENSSSTTEYDECTLEIKRNQAKLTKKAISDHLEKTFVKKGIFKMRDTEKFRKKIEEEYLKPHMEMKSQNKPVDLVIDIKKQNEDILNQLENQLLKEILDESKEKSKDIQITNDQIIINQPISDGITNQTTSDKVITDQTTSDKVITDQTTSDIITIKDNQEDNQEDSQEDNLDDDNLDDDYGDYCFGEDRVIGRRRRMIRRSAKKYYPTH